MNLRYCQCVCLPYDFLLDVFFSLAPFFVRIQNVIHTTCEICVNQLFTLLVGLPVSGRLLVGKFWGSKNYVHVFTCTGQLCLLLFARMKEKR